jgi:hypothetical protein
LPLAHCELLPQRHVRGLPLLTTSPVGHVKLVPVGSRRTQLAESSVAEALPLQLVVLPQALALALVPEET